MTPIWRGKNPRKCRLVDAPDSTDTAYFSFWVRIIKRWVRMVVVVIVIVIIQSTTRITDFLVVDKSSVILVKRPKIR